MLSDVTAETTEDDLILRNNKGGIENEEIIIKLKFTLCD